jgi:hypothetical protein
MDLFYIVIMMETQRNQYKWKNLAWSATRRNEKKWTLQESQWFNKKEDCIADFKEKMKNGYDVADSWGSEEYLKRRVMPRKYFPY